MGMHIAIKEKNKLPLRNNTVYTFLRKAWERGIQKPPSRIRVRAVKLEDGTVEAELVGE